MKIKLGNSMILSSILTSTLQVSQKEKREKGAENRFEEIIAENF